MARGGEHVRSTQGRTAAPDQSGRKRTPGHVLESGDDSPQLRGVHDELHLRVPERAAGEADVERDRKSGARQEAAARAGGEYRTIRNAVRADPRGARGGSGAKSGVRALIR